MKKNLLTAFLLFLSVCTAFGQTRTITGKVTDQKDGSPLPGVNVTVKGMAATGTQTNIDGLYSLSVPTDTKFLTFKFLGYKQADLPVTGNILNVQLEPDLKQLSEVVVVGYGTQKRGELTGSVASVASKDIEGTPVTTFEQAIQGKMAGVLIQADNGKLGQGIKISVRGSASISAGTQPLVVLDGIIVSNNDLSNSNFAGPSDPLADINFNDIESIDVLKDAAASAIYGARASNGVIILTSKKGKAGTAKINFTSQYGYSTPSGNRQFLNTQQWMAIEERAGVGEANQAFNAQDPNDPNRLYPTLNDALTAYKNSVEAHFTRYAAGSTNWTAYNTNWEDQAYQRAPQQQYDLNLSGGSDKLTYFMGGQYLDQTGMLVGNAFKRYSARINLDSKLSKNLEVGINFDFANTINKRVANDDGFNTPLQIVALSPVTPVIDPRTGLLSGSLPGVASNYPVYYNPLIDVNNAYFHTIVYRTLGNVFGVLKLAKGLSFRTEFGLDQTNHNEDSYFGSLTFRNTGTPNGSGENTNTTILHYTVNNYLSYKNIFKQDHSLDITAGTTYEFYDNMLNDVDGQQFPSDAYKEIASAAVINGGSSQQFQYSFVSYFSRLNYGYKSKYLVSLSARTDASSRFGANNRYGFFPSGSVGWVLSQEDFLKNVNYLSNLKIRASYGLTGNAETGNYASLGLFGGGSSYNGAAGQGPTQIANPNLKWESTAQLDLGLDVGFFNNRLSAEFDYYNKQTHNLLLNVNIPGTTGFGTQTQNLGKLYNKGIEVVLSSDNFVGKFKWTTSVNFAWNVNKVTFVNGQIIGTSNLNRVIEGQPIGVFYGPEYAGVNPANGDALYYLNTKNADGTLNRGTTKDYDAAQDVVLGNPTPKYTGGITNTFSYSGFDLSLSFQGVYGNKIFNSAGQYMSSNASNGYDNQTIDQLSYWTKPGDITNVPEPRLFDPNGTNNSSRYLSNGSYLRLKTASLGYTLPKALVSKWNIEKVRVFVNGFNLFKITPYKGWDPEVNADFSASNISLGNDFYSAPQPRTITFGVNIGL